MHAGNTAGIQTCIDAGVDGIEHGVGMTDEQAQAMIDQNIFWTPTIHILSHYYREYKAAGHVKDADYLYFKRAAKFYDEMFLKYYKRGSCGGRNRYE